MMNPKKLAIVLKIALIILVFSLVLVTTIAQDLIPIKADTEVKSVTIDLLLNDDGSVDVTIKLLEVLYPPNNIQNLTNLTTFEVRIADSKSVQDLTIRDLRSPNNQPLTETSKLIAFECIGKYVFNRLKNDAEVCTLLNKENELNFEIKYKYLQDITCIEKEKVRQNVTFALPSQKSPYYALITYRASDNLNHVSPQSCLEGWTKYNIPNGIACEKKDMYYYNPDYVLELSSQLTADIKSIIKEQEENKIQDKLKLKDIILKIIATLALVFGFLGYKEKILTLYRANTLNKFIIWGVVLFSIFIYALFLWW